MGERAAPLPARLLAWAVGPKTTSPTRPQNGAHRPSACCDRSCQRPSCTAYREGYEDGFEEGYGAGSAAGYAAGQADASNE
jgi:hypothetical protein